jgi:hypothetical protein
MQLDYSSNDIMRMTVNFTYRHYTQVWGDKENTGGAGGIEVSKNLKAIHKNESDESFRERMGIKVTPANQLKETFPRGQFDN